MEQTENPLLSLSSEKQQQIVDLVDNGNIGEIAEKGGMTRRQVLQVAVALGAGATVGGYSIDQIIGEARAAADTSDSDGNVGLPGDRVDVFAEGVDVSGNLGAGSVSTNGLNITEIVNYWPPVRIDESDELDSSTPATTYTTVQLASLPADSTVALLRVFSQGDGGSSTHSMLVREAGTTRAVDAEVRGWAGHGDFDARESPLFVPVNESQEIEYKTVNSSRAIIRVVGYF